MGVDEPRDRGIEAGRAELPRVEDLPVSENGYDRERVHEAFEAFHRHALQLETALRVLESVNTFNRHAVELSEQLRELRAASWGPQGAAPPQRRDAYAEAAPAGRRAPAARGRRVDSIVLPIAPPAPRRGPVLRLALEAAFVVAVAVACAIGGLSEIQIALVMALAWALVVLSEFAAARQRAPESAPLPDAARGATFEPERAEHDDFDTSWDSDVLDAPAVGRDETSESKTVVVPPSTPREPVELPPLADLEAEVAPEAVLPPPLEEPEPLPEGPLREDTDDDDRVPEPADAREDAPVAPVESAEPVSEQAEPVAEAAGGAADSEPAELEMADLPDSPEPAREPDAGTATSARRAALTPLEPLPSRRRFWSRRRRELPDDVQSSDPEADVPKHVRVIPGAEPVPEPAIAASDGEPAALAAPDVTAPDVAAADAAAASTNGASETRARPIPHTPRRRVRSRRRRR